MHKITFTCIVALGSIIYLNCAHSSTWQKVLSIEEAKKKGYTTCTRSRDFFDPCVVVERGTGFISGPKSVNLYPNGGNDTNCRYLQGWGLHYIESQIKSKYVISPCGANKSKIFDYKNQADLKSQFKKCQEGLDTNTFIKSKEVDKSPHVMFKNEICVYQRTTCFSSGIRNKDKGALRCVDAPLQPGPNPMCPIPSLGDIGIKFVPFKGATLQDPKIRVIIGDSGTKKCSDGVIISKSATCADGSLGIPNHTVIEDISAPRDGTKKTINVVYPHTKKQYTFSAKLEENSICGSCEITSTEEAPCDRKCFHLSMDKDAVPRIGAQKKLIFNHKFYGSYAIGNVSSPSYISFPETWNKKIWFIKPKMDQYHRMILKCKCTNGSIVRVGEVCNDQSQPNCSEYDHNPNGNIICVANWKNSPAKYAIYTKSQVISGYNQKIIASDAAMNLIIAKSNKDANTRNASTTSINKQMYKYPVDVMSLNSLTQPELDSIKYLDTNIKTPNDLQFSAIDPTTKIQITKRYEQLDFAPEIYPSEVYFRSINLNPTHYEALDVLNTDINTIQKAYMRRSQYLHAGSLRPVNQIASGYENNFIYCTNTDKNGKCITVNQNFGKFIRPENPLDQDLCISATTGKRFPEITFTSDASFIVNNTTNKCDFVRFKATGGGESGNLKGKLSHSGEAGGYAEALFYTNWKSGDKYFKLSVGQGGNVQGKSGSSTSISQCSDVSMTQNCKMILQANGGGSKPTNQATGVILDDINALEGVIQSGGGKQYINTNGNSGYSLPYQGPNISIIKPWSDSGSCGTQISRSKFGIIKSQNGGGGCVNLSRNIWQPGGDGKIKVTCEQWTQ